MQGLYKVEIQTEGESRRGVLYAYDRKLLGGNSAFAYIGFFEKLPDDRIVIELSVRRHRQDPQFRSWLDIDRMTLRLRGVPSGAMFRLEGEAEELPGATFKILMTPIGEEVEPKIINGSNPLENGLYALEAELFDGVDGGGNAGVLVLLDGTLHGGDGCFGYVGSYTSADGRWKGEAIVREHTPADGNRLLFGGREVGIGYSGTYDDKGGRLQCMALNGKRSIRYGATMRKVSDSW